MRLDPVPIRAKSSPSYLRRLGLTAAVCCGIGLWFLYDGAIVYPRQAIRAQEYQRLAEEERLDEWPEIAKSRGWETADPGEPKTEYDSYVQFFIAGCLVLPMVYSAIQFIRYRGRWIELDQDTMSTSWGVSFRLDEIVKLDKRLWQNKGIVKIKYATDSRRGRLILDDLKFEAEQIEGILGSLDPPAEPAAPAD